ncbi:MAG: hypothetical protein WBA13_01220 [Microcoleaceae cyanobacterium]
MKLLKSILETVTEKVKSACNGTTELFIKGCEPDSLDRLWKWLSKQPSTPTREIDLDPVVPFGGF